MSAVFGTPKTSALFENLVYNMVLVFGTVVVIHTYTFFVKSVHTIIFIKIFQYGNNNKKNDANNEDELSKLEELKFSPSNESNEVNDSEKKDISTAVASSSTASSMTSTASPTIPNNAQLNSTSSHSRQSSQVSNFAEKNMLKINYIAYIFVFTKIP